MRKNNTIYENLKFVPTKEDIKLKKSNLSK